MTALSMDPRLRARRAQVLRLQGRRRLWFVTVVTAAGFVGASAWWLVQGSPFLDVDAVIVEGVRETSVDEVISASGVVLHQPLLDVDGSASRAEISTLPWVLAVQSQRSLDGEVTFVVTERVAVAVVRGTQGWLVVDRQGRVLEATAELPRGLVVVAESVWRAGAGDWLGEQALPALQVAATLSVGLAPKVASIQTVDDGLTLSLFGGGRVLLGSTVDLEVKFLSALTMIVRADLGCLDRIDVRAPSVPVLTRVADCS